MVDPDSQDPVYRMRQRIRVHVAELAGDEKISPRGLELVSLVKMVSNLYEGIRPQRLELFSLSAPRWGVLMFIMAEEQAGKSEGVTPTMISQCQQVSKNTVSALLRGLEEQDLIQRTLDQKDRRIFRIKLSDAGRQLIHSASLNRFTFLNELVSALTPPQQEQLADLLEALFHSITSRVHPFQPGIPEIDPFVPGTQTVKPETRPGG
jgi:DNA-binding MarR family transcriptional regulator